MIHASLGAILKIIARSHFTVWGLCCFGLLVFLFFLNVRIFVQKKKKKSKDTISFNFGLLLALPVLVLPCWNVLLPSAKQHRVLAQKVGGSSTFKAAADSPAWIIYQGCCSSGCGSDAISVATSVLVSFHHTLLGPAHPGWHRLLGGLGNCVGSQQRSSRRAVASSATNILPPARLQIQIAGMLPNTSKKARQRGVKPPTLCCLYVAWGQLL